MRRHKSKERRQVRKRGMFRMVKKFLGGFATLLLLVGFTFAVFAEETSNPTAEPAGKPVEENIQPGEKLVEGIEETATGWVEVPKEMAETSEETNPVEGVTVGTVKGAGEAVVKTTEGAVKTATFYIPEEKEEEKKE